MKQTISEHPAHIKRIEMKTMNSSGHINLTTQMKWANSLKKCELPKLTQYKMDNSNSSVTIKEIEFVI